jgi:tetratricopeptide (TPR) repeat protein
MLARAGEIYGAHHHQTGTGSVLVNAGHLHLESGDIDRAAREAEKAFALGKDKHDQILMARARILHSAVELARAEEDIEEDAGVEAHAALALEYAGESVELAHHTQNKRLLAAAYIARGLVAAADFFEDWEAAKSYAAKANDLLNRDDRDHLLKELTALKTKLLHSAGINPTLRQWSEGYLGNKTFQQIQEEFAEIVIPKVWLNNGKNVTRVAQQLSISPKKVRRILRNVELPKN